MFPLKKEKDYFKLEKTRLQVKETVRMSPTN